MATGAGTTATPKIEPPAESSPEQTTNSKDRRNGTRGKQNSKAGASGIAAGGRTDRAETIALQNAVKTKREYNAAMAAYQTLKDACSKTKEWEWANHAVILKPIDDAYGAVQNNINPFAMDFLVMDAKDVRRRFGHEEFVSKCREMPLSLDEPLRELRRRIETLRAKHLCELKSQL